MKKTILFSVLMIAFFALPAAAVSSSNEFLEAPVIADGKTLVKTDKRLEMQVPLTHDGALAFYKSALEKYKDIKFRDWEEATYIEDDGRLPWHSITISKGSEANTRIVIVKDNWTWIIGTLIIRFIAVFVVLLVLYLGMNVSGKLISSAAKKAEEKKAEAKA